MQRQIRHYLIFAVSPNSQIPYGDLFFLFVLFCFIGLISLIRPYKKSFFHETTTITKWTYPSSVIKTLICLRVRYSKERFTVWIISTDEIISKAFIKKERKLKLFKTNTENQNDTSQMWIDRYHFTFEKIGIRLIFSLFTSAKHELIYLFFFFSPRELNIFNAHI